MMDICNIKFHCRVGVAYLNKLVEQFRHKSEKKFPSFVVFKLEKYSYVCYYSGFINITGIKTYSDIKLSLKNLQLFLNFSKLKFTSLRIDNITCLCTCVKEKRICLSSKLKKLQTLNLPHIIKSIKYEREIFPNMFIKTKYGTIIWSSNNKVSCVGVKSCKKNFKKICNLITKIDKL